LAQAEYQARALRHGMRDPEAARHHDSSAAWHAIKEMYLQHNPKLGTHGELFFEQLQAMHNTERKQVPRRRAASLV
jgi:hypothetical protein